MKRILAKFFGACLVLLYIATLIVFLIDFEGIGNYLFVLIASSFMYLLPGVLLLRVGKRREQAQRNTFNQQINHSQWGSNDSKGAVSPNNYFDLQAAKNEVTTDFLTIQVTHIEASSDLSNIQATNTETAPEKEKLNSVLCNGCGAKVTVSSIKATQCEYCGTVIQT